MFSHVRCATHVFFLTDWCSKVAREIFRSMQHLRNLLRRRRNRSRRTGRVLEALYWKPWSPSELSSRLKPLDAKGLAALLAGRPAGVMTRHRLSIDTPEQIPDLIGVEHRRYLDHTGLQLHRGIGDLMRYAALNQGADDLASFGGFCAPVALAGWAEGDSRDGRSL